MDSPCNVESLLQRCQQGDEAAFGELMRRYQERVFQFTLRVSGDASLAEEATVDCFYRIWTKCRQRREGASPDAWIFRIAHRALVDLARKRQRWWNRLAAGSRTSEDDLRPGPLEALLEAEHQRQLAGEMKLALETLKEEDRVLVHLYYFEGQAIAEIATVLETSRDALKMRLLRVRKKLAKVLESGDDCG